jgi:hypothetical protein
MSPVAAGSLFVPDGDHWVPTDLARGPWDPGALHGGPVAALLTRALEAIEAPVPMRLARVTIELLRPVTIVPLALSTEVVRPGGKVGLLGATLRRVDDGQVVAVARGLRIRSGDVDFDDGAHDVVPDLPAVPATTAEVSPVGNDYPAYHNTAVEHRFVRGAFGRPGPVFDWIRLVVPVVPDEVPTGWQRAAAIADFANGLSAVVPFDGTALFINPDLTVHLWREPEGEWIGMESETRTSGSGIGMSDTALWDRTGRVGRGVQSLLLDRT